MKFYRLTINSQHVGPVFIQNIMLILQRFGACLSDSCLTQDENKNPVWTITISHSAQGEKNITALANSIESNGLCVSGLNEVTGNGLNTSHVVTLMHNKLLSDKAIQAFKHLTACYDFKSEKPLGSRAHEMRVNLAEKDLPAFRDKVLSLSEALQLDIAVQKLRPERRNIQLAAFDMDSTLIQHEVIDELANVAACKDEVAKITEEAMRGNIDFRQSLLKRLKLLDGLPEKALEQAHTNITLTPGAKRLVDALHALNCKTIILSGGFSWFARRLQHKLGMYASVANDLEIRDGKLTGHIRGTVVDAEVKKNSFLKYVKSHDIALENTLAAGDGANDIPVLQSAGTGIAFHAKPATRNSVEVSIILCGLDSILYLLGWHDNEIDFLLSGAVWKLQPGSGKND